MTYDDDSWFSCPAQDRPSERRSSRRRQALMYCCVAVMFFGLGSAFGATQPGSSRDRATPSHTVTVTASPAPAPSASASASARQAASQDSPEQRSRTAGAGVGAGSTIPGDGTYLVGEDIQPGTYQAGGADGLCYPFQSQGL